MIIDQDLGSILVRSFQLVCLGPALFFCFLKKCRDSDHLKFGEAFYFFIHPSFGPKNAFESNLYTFTSKFGNFIRIFNRNENILVKKDYFYLAKSRHLF